MIEFRCDRRVAASVVVLLGLLTACGASGTIAEPRANELTTNTSAEGSYLLDVDEACKDYVSILGDPRLDDTMSVHLTALAAQTSDPELAAAFQKMADQYAENEDVIPTGPVAVFCN